MIRKLQLKFVAICMAMVTAIMAVVFGSVYLSVQKNIESLSRQVLHQVLLESSLSGGSFLRPEIKNPWNDDRVLLPYFTVEVWGSHAYVTGGTYSDLENTESLRAILKDCLSQPEQEGTIRPYGLRYLRENNGLYQRIAFVDMSMEVTMLRSLMGPYLAIALLSLLLLLGVSVLLSRWAVRPVERAWSQQRQFLSDASHELKTPLTVILSNAELLESTPLEERPARWADNIHSEAGRMKSLVEEMLTLARADNMARTDVFSQVSLSDLASDCVLSFEPVFFEAGRTLDYSIQEELHVRGDGEKLRQLISILLDNAIKYGDPGGPVTLTLERGERQARLTVSNPGTPIDPEQLSHLFERFYRADASRGEQRGFGLGLSIAKAITQEHHGTIRAESDAQSTRFLVSIPLQK